MFPNRTFYCDFETLPGILFSAGFIFTAIKLVERILKRIYQMCQLKRQKHFYNKEDMLHSF